MNLLFVLKNSLSLHHESNEAFKIKPLKMKTTTKVIALKKLSKLNTSKSSIVYKVIIDLLMDTNTTYKVFGNAIRTVHTSGSGRFTSNQDHTASIKDTLNAIGIETELSNDSKRGGLTGNLLTIITKLK